MKKKVRSSQILKSNHLTNLKLKLQVLTISLFIISAVAGKLLYLGFIGDNDLEGNFISFRWLSAFLYSFGTELSFLSFGSLMWISTVFHPKKSQSKKLFRFVAVLMLLLAFFFLSWIFTDKPYWTDSIEIAFAMLISIPTTIVFVMFLMFISREITGIKELRNMIANFLVEIRNTHVFGLLKNANMLESLNNHNVSPEQKQEILARLKLERKIIMDKLDKSLKEHYKSINP
ncbi:hypothetical protein [Flagellimonas sp. 2504JD4-2]